MMGTLSVKRLVFGLLSLNSFVSATTIPTPPGRVFTKLDDAQDLLQGFINQFQASIPAVTQASIDLFNTLLSGLFTTPYTTPQQSRTPLTRTLNLAIVRFNFLYGPPVGGGPYYPTGLLGLAKVAQDAASLVLELTPRLTAATLDLAKATLDSPKYEGLGDLDDYVRLYDDEWLNSLPDGTDPGVLTNYTQDLLFSMQRLSNSPYRVRRLDPGSKNPLPFAVDDITAMAISGTSLQQLLQDGRLFYADYRDQQGLTPTFGRYTANTDAYFYIDSGRSGDFLPLAVRTNNGANSLIYTPLDGPGEWLLAKMMVNVNDFWFGQWNHLAFTHETVQIIWMAAIRSLSHEHPVFGVLNRLMLQVFSIQILAQGVLFTPGGAVDSVFAYSGQSAQAYTTAQYKNGYGNFQANFFLTNLQTRGLVNSTYGPPLKHFPFYEDAGTIHTAIRTFVTSFIQSYYPSDAAVLADTEIQNWVAEAQGPAKVLGFPAITTRNTLVDVITQLAHLVSSAHHTVNTNELLQVTSALPFCPPALYKPLPTTKNATLNPAEWLPPLNKVFEQLVLGALFARPQFAGSNRTILHMFDDPNVLRRMNGATRAANTEFMRAMRGFSERVSGRGFDAEGLSQGMPFVWRALDPNVAPFNVAT